MTVEELLDALSEYPKNLELSDVKISVSVERELGQNRMRSVYLAHHRIAGEHPWGCVQHMERQTNLQEIAKSLLQGLKLHK